MSYLRLQRVRHLGASSMVRHCLLLLATSACSDGPSATHGIVGGLRITTSAQRSTIHPGDTVGVRVVARNLSDTVVRIADPFVSCALQVVVSGPGAVNYYSRVKLCPDGQSTATIPIVLAPGDSLVGASLWPGISYVSTSRSVLGQEIRAPFGTYYAVGSLRTGLRTSLVGDSAKIVVGP